jgi:hypothetical protein
MNTVKLTEMVSFRGLSGAARAFELVGAASPWALRSGVAIFAARAACGWRVIRVVELSGKPHDVQPIWALAEAERYGATAVFIADEAAADVRRALAEDIETGFRPVIRLVSLAA